MPNIVKEINEERERNDREELISIEVPLEEIRSNVKTEDGMFDDNNRWEFDLGADVLNKLGLDREDDVTIQFRKIPGIPIVNINVLE